MDPKLEPGYEVRRSSSPILTTRAMVSGCRDGM
jgi:hypothetical protein